MTWVLFWADDNCASHYPRTGKDASEIRYEWLSKISSEDCMEDYAQEFAPGWMKDSERGYRYGWEEIKELPEDVKQYQIKYYKNQINYANQMLKILGGK